MSDINIVILAQEGKLESLVNIFSDGSVICKIGDGELRNALFWAVRNGHFKVVELLILNGADIEFIYYNEQDELYRTIMDIGISSGDIETVKILVKYKVDINYTNHTPTKFGNNIDILKYLISINAKIEPNHWRYIEYGILYNPIKYNDLDIVELLIQSKININCQYRNNMSYIRLAASKEHLDCVKLLLEHKSFIDPYALKETCINGNIEIAKLLINVKTNVNTAARVPISNNIYNSDNSDSNYIFKAAEHNHPKIIKLLVDAGFVMNTFIAYQALLSACDQNRLSVVKAIMQDGHSNFPAIPLQLQDAVKRPEVITRLYRYPEIEKYIKSVYQIKKT
jgi:ankyrin repeat protein